MHKETLSVQSGTYHDAATRGINTPIFTSSSYEYLDRQNCPYPVFHVFSFPAINSLTAWFSAVPRPSMRIGLPKAK